MRIARISCIAAVILAAFGIAQAQNQTMTPYSRYGYGMLSDNATSAQKAMGGVGYAMNSGRQINVMNPASYAAIDSLTFLFDMGLNLDFLHASEEDLTENNIGGGLDYITMSFPIAKRLGAALGMLPYSSTGYSFYDTVTNASTMHTGSGNLNQLFLGLGYSPLKGLCLGFNFGYLFGSITNDVYAYTITGSTTLFERYMTVRDWRLDIGAQYTAPVGVNDRMTIGVTFSPEKKLHGETYGLFYDATTSTKVDTVGYTKLNGNYTIPASYGAGINYRHGNKLMVEADFTYQPWKNARYKSIEDFEITEFDDRWKVACGVQYQPNYRGPYFSRVQYRAGAYYNHDYLKIRGNNVREYGVSLGFGFPVTGYKTVINLGVEYKHRQANPNPLVKEQYFSISLGVNFNEMWFRKSRIY